MLIKKIPIILILVLSLFLSLYGIRFGLPNKERAKVSGKIPEERIKKVLAEGRWQRSEFIAPAEKKEIASLTSYFDILRSYHPDEELILKYLSHMHPRRFDFDTKNYIYAPFFSYQVGLGIFLGALLHRFPLKQDIFFYLKNPDDFAKLYLTGRYVIILFALLTILFVYLIGRRIYNERVGILSSLFLAVAPLFVMQSHFIKPDIPAVFWVTLSFYFALSIIETKRLKYYILSGIAAGLAMGSKYPGILALIPVVTAHFIAQNGFRKIFLPLIAVFSALFAFFFTSPYTLIYFSRFLHDFRWIAGAVTTKSSLLFHFLNSSLYYSITAFLYSFSPLLFLLLLGCFFFALKRHTFREFFLLSGAIPFIFFMFLSKPGFDTYWLPGLPFLVILAGNFFNIAILKKKISIFAKSILLFAIVGSAFYYTFSFERIAKNSDIRMEASHWIEENIPKGAKIGMAKYPVIYRMPAINAERYVTRAGDLKELLNQGIDYYILVSDDWGFFNPCSFFTGKPLVNDATASLLKSREFSIIKRFEIIPPLPGIFPQKRFQLSSPFEFITPTFIILKKNERK